VTGSFAGRTASHVDVTGCALRGALFTGAEIDRLRLVDSVVEDCELPAVVLPRLAVARVEFHRCRLSGLGRPAEPSGTSDSLIANSTASTSV
jgi:hypothetical protein